MPFDLELPDGTVIQGVPDGTTKADIIAKFQGNGVQLPPEWDAPADPMQQLQSEFEAQKNPSFYQRNVANFGKRLDEAQLAADKAVAGEISPASAYLQFAGKLGAGTAQDVAGEVLGAVTPDFVKEAGKNVLNRLSNTRAGELVAAGANSAAKAYGNFAQNHPEAAGNIESVVNIGAMYPAGKIIKGAGDVSADAAIATGQGVKNTAGKVAKAALPAIDEGLQDTAKLAVKYNIPLSFDQITKSPAVKNVQKVSQEMPFSGQAAFRDKQMSAFNKALLNTVGVEGDKITKANMDKAFTAVGKEFDDLGKGKTFNLLNDDFLNNVDNILKDTTATKDAQAIFERELKNVLGNADQTGNIKGETLSALRNRLNKLSRTANDPDTKDLLTDLENSVIDAMTFGDDAASGAFSETKRKYKNLLAIEPLAAKAKGGNISPSLLNNRISKIYGRAHTRGNAGEIGDLAQVGYELLPELGGSDTTQKMIYATGATGSALANLPATAGALGANRAMQSGLNRNQSLIKKALSMEEIMKLPPKEAEKHLRIKKSKK